MRVLKLKIINVGKIAETEISFDKPLLLFYGEIKQGKTTLLNCVRWVCGGSFPQDIIQHGKEEASVELHFSDPPGMISRSWYRGKGNVTKARDVEFIKNGRPQKSPVAEIKRMLNPFLIDQDFLRNKSELERRQYFTELFSVDTAELDDELYRNQKEAEKLRATIAGYGEIDLKPFEKVDVTELKKQLAKINDVYRADREEWDRQCRAIEDDYGTALGNHALANAAVQTHNKTYDDSVALLTAKRKEIEEIKQALSAAEQRAAGLEAWIGANSKQTPAEPPQRPARPAEPAKPNVAELETKIQDAGAQNVRAEQYLANKKRDEQKGADERALEKLEDRQREIKKLKQSKLKTVADSTGIKGLEFDDKGDFIYQGTTAGMISDSQIITLSSELSALYPEGFGLDLLDRAESLGKSIFGFVERAQAEKKTIMATIVGERPAKVPEHIGVFVVEDGKVTPSPDKPEAQKDLI